MEAPSIYSEKKLHITDTKIIDLESLRIIANNNKDMMNKIIDMFVEVLPKEVEALQSVYQQQDWKALELSLHKLHGLALYCGAMRFQKVVRELENYIRSGEREKLGELYQNVLGEITAIIDCWQD